MNMNQITCPHCKKSFEIDQEGYAHIISQVRNDEFNRELKERLSLAEKEKNTAIENAKEAVKSSLRIEFIRQQTEAQEKVAKKENELTKLQAEKDSQIAKLHAELNAKETQNQLSLAEKTSQLEKEVDRLNSDLKLQKKEAELEENSIKQNYEQELAMKDKTIEFYKDMKAKQSTKMLGESLEKHCEIEFNKLRSTAFMDSTFEKDNEAIKGDTKGDYIFREVDENGNEVVSIMFEMKNEADATATKKKNEDFLDKLDKDRVKKNCEYAVLVSLLESDNELYNTGIVDKSHRHQKMYVIRPQFFIPLISLLRNAGKNSLQYKQELAVMRSQSVDIENFESELEKQKTGFQRNLRLASEKFKNAIDGINKTIKELEKTKEALISSEKNLVLANDKLQSTTIRKLTKNSPILKEEFAKIQKKD